MDRTKTYHSATNGKAERFNRTLVDEWAYARLWTSEAQRTRTLDPWLHPYNHHRCHTPIPGPPASRVNNLAVYNNYFSLTDGRDNNSFANIRTRLLPASVSCSPTGAKPKASWKANEPSLRGRMFTSAHRAVCPSARSTNAS